LGAVKTHYGFTDDLRDDGRDGISAGAKAVHSAGKPINNSEKTGSNIVVVFWGSPR
jgi:hypothetical protein